MNGYWIYYYQNQSYYAKGQTGFLSVTIKDFDGSYCTNCVVNGTLDGKYVEFINQNNGSYVLYPTFDRVGYYLLNLTIYNPKYPPPTFKLGRYETYIAVPKLSLYVSLVGGTEYEPEESLKIVAHLTDENGYPVSGADLKITIYYPDNSRWVHKKTMTELENGLYVWDSKVPNIKGVYTVFVNASYGTEWVVDSKTFHVAEWSESISDINKLVKYIPGIRNSVESIRAIINFIVGNLVWIIILIIVFIIAVLVIKAIWKIPKI